MSQKAHGFKRAQSDASTNPPLPPPFENASTNPPLQVADESQEEDSEILLNATAVCSDGKARYDRTMQEWKKAKKEGVTAADFVHTLLSKNERNFD